MELKRLMNMISVLDERDEHIVKQLIAILFRYFEKRGRLSR